MPLSQKQCAVPGCRRMGQPTCPDHPLPMTLTVAGTRRHIVGMNAEVWTEREPSGRLVHHVGQLLLNGQTPTKLIAKPRKCSVCKGPTYTTTTGGRPIHDMCEGLLNILPDDLAARVIFGVAVDLGASILTDSPTKEARRAA